MCSYNQVVCNDVTSWCGMNSRCISAILSWTIGTKFRPLSPDALANDLELNVNKAKEIILDCRENPTNTDPLHINSSEVEIVNHFKFLGVQMSTNLKWGNQCRSDCEQGSAEALLPSTSEVVWCQSGADGKVLQGSD